MYFSIWGTTSLYTKDILFTNKLEAIIDKHITFTMFLNVTTFKLDEKWTKFSPKCFGKGPV